MTAVSLSNWEKLYRVAAEFKHVAPWQWMEESNIFAVKQPANSGLGFCSILGRLGEHFALNVYLGMEGLQSFFRMIEYDGDYIYDVVFSQNALTVSFEDRETVEKEDLEIISKLGLHFSGKAAYPVFRLLEPEIVPLPLESNAQVLYLINVIQQALQVTQEFKERTEELFLVKENKILTRAPQKSSTGFNWQNEWTTLPAEFKVALPPYVPFNQIKAELLAQSAKRTQARWIVDYAVLPLPVYDESVFEKPFFPRVFLIVDVDSQFIIHYVLTDKRAFHEHIKKELLQLIEKKKEIPETIYVFHPETQIYLMPLAEHLDFNLQMQEKNPLFDHIANEVVQMNKKPVEKHEKSNH